MATVTTDKPVNLYQLAQALGGVGLRKVGPMEDGTTRISTDAVDQATLDAAIAAHVADPAVVPPAPPPPAPSTEQRLAAVAAAVEQAAQVETIADMEALRGALAARPANCDGCGPT